MSLETIAVHGGSTRPPLEGSIVFPIFQGTVYSVPKGASYDEIRYHRLSSTPSQVRLHARLASLEGAEAALATASGMAALSACLLSVLRAGDHVIAGDCGYGGTMSFLFDEAPRLGVQYTLVDAQRPGTWAKALRPTTRAILVETITNPLMRVPDLEAIVAFARAHRLTSILDNTFASPVNFRPLTMGFDLVVHSATKYLNGHSDLVAGCVMGRREAIARVRKVVSHFGGTLDPHAGFLLDRGLKTLAVRVAASNINGLALAGFLAAHRNVSRVNYPGLPSHPDHERASRLFRGMGGMLSLQVKGGARAADRLLGALRVPFVAPSLGGVETLVTRPATTSHVGMSRADRLNMGVTDDLVRVSCGIEGTADLLADFEQALDRV
jgi:cystathionine gamma-synthase/cystathionine gamma-lyase/cystathionine beta-lyase